MSKVVFLGGTVGQNHWRENHVIPALVNMGVPETYLFNPVVDDWNEEAQELEEQARKDADYLLFVIANPFIEGNEVSPYSLFEMIMAFYKNPERVVVALDDSALSNYAAKHIRKGFGDLRRQFPGAPIFDDVDDAVQWLAPHLVD